jgi:hypothetical protein
VNFIRIIRWCRWRWRGFTAKPVDRRATLRIVAGCLKKRTRQTRQLRVSALHHLNPRAGFGEPLLELA